MSLATIRSSRCSRITGNVILIALFLGGHCAQAATPPETAGKVSRLIDASGIAHSARQILPGVLGGFDAPQQDIPVQVLSALRDAAAQAFQPGPIIERVRARLGAGLTARQLDDTLAWLDSPLGRRITAMENESAEPAAVARIQAYARELEQRPPAKHRASLIGELNRATGSAELTASLVEATTLAAALGFNAAQPVEQQVPADVLRRQVKSSLPKARKETDQMVILSLFYAYRLLSDQELESYLKFLKSPSGAAYSRGALAGFSEALLEAIGRFMVALPKSLDKHKRTTGT